MKIILNREIQEGATYLDKWGRKWIAKYNPDSRQVQPFHVDAGFGLWLRQVFNIVAKLFTGKGLITYFL